MYVNKIDIHFNFVLDSGAPGFSAISSNIDRSGFMMRQPG
jgi:hypothetical protein